MEHIRRIIKRLQEQDLKTSERIDKEERLIEEEYKEYKKWRIHKNTHSSLTLEQFRNLVKLYCKQ